MIMNPTNSNDAAERECDHTRGTDYMQRTAITVCRNCRDFICAICGLTIEGHEKLYVTNPPMQWRYCVKPACLEVEAAYHGHSIEEMAKHRLTLRAKRLALQIRGRGSDDKIERTILPSGATHIKVTPLPFTLDPGEACWCNRGKDCDGSHEIYLADPTHVCGLCGQIFQITKDDPHWVTGRGPLCPTKAQ